MRGSTIKHPVVPDVDWTYARLESASKSKNSPFDGWRMKGKAVATIVAGKVVGG